MLKISIRLTLWYSLATGLIIILAAWAMYGIYDARRRDAIDTDLKDYAEFLVSGVGGESTNFDQIFDDLVDKKRIPPSRPKSHRFALASNDSIYYETSALENLDSLINELEIRREFSYATDYNTIKYNNTEYRTYIKNIKAKTGAKYQLIVLTSLDKLYESLGQLRNTLLLLTPFSLLAAAVIGFLIARKALKPIRILTKTASQISSTSLDRRVPLGKSKDELSELAQTFNEMINRLDITFKSQQNFVADASHDLRTPLTVIQMELELLLTNNVYDENEKEAIYRCLNEIERLSRLTDNLLILARADANQLVIDKKPLRLDEIVIDCISKLNNLANNKDLKFIINSNLPIEIIADESMMRRVFINLIDNAIKFSPFNESIIVYIGQEKKDNIVSISNKGTPLSKELTDKIFDRFHRGDKSRTTKGFGLGLSIVNAIVTAHYGKIEIVSDEIHGTTIKIILPK